MASLRRLPSGNVQASFLIGSRRVTKTFPNSGEAQAWAIEQEEERDELRRLNRELEPNAYVDLLLERLEERVGKMTEDQVKELESLARRARKAVTVTNL
jgi:hypothetical protein